jgi:hypothetical protein
MTICWTVASKFDIVDMLNVESKSEKEVYKL